MAKRKMIGPWQCLIL